MKLSKISPNVMLCLPGIIALPVALFAPLNVLENHTFDMFVKFVETFVPMVKRINPFLDTWQIAKLFYSVAWCFIPVSTLFWMHRLQGNKAKALALINSSKTKRIGIILIVPMLVVFVWYKGFSDHESGRAVFITYSRLGMATIGALLMAVEACIAAYVLNIILNFREFIFGDSNA